MNNNDNQSTDITAAEEHVCCIAIYDPIDQTHARATALVSSFSNKLVDRLEFPNLDFGDEDAIGKAVEKIQTMVEKYQAYPIPLDRFCPLAKCATCKALLDVGVLIDNPKNPEEGAHLSYACWHCKKWVSSDDSDTQNTLDDIFESALEASLASFGSKGISLEMTGDISRTEAGAMLALTAAKMEKAIVDGGHGEGEITSVSGRKLGEWKVNVGSKKEEGAPLRPHHAAAPCKVKMSIEVDAEVACVFDAIDGLLFTANQEIADLIENHDRQSDSGTVYARNGQQGPAIGKWSFSISNK